MLYVGELFDKDTNLVSFLRYKTVVRPNIRLKHILNYLSLDNIIRSRKPMIRI